jgi:site-specific DNA-methyltransferase (adenine-specific)
MSNDIKEYLNITNEDNMQLMKRYPDNYFDLAIVDPPYGIGESSNDNKGRSKLAKSKDYGRKTWDDKAPSKEYFKELKRVSKNQIIFGANHFIENIPSANSSCWLVWDKVNGQNDFADCELAYCSFETAVRMISLRWHGMLQHDMKNKEIRIHPTQKPVSLYTWIISKYASKNFNILDTHLGSASIAIAIDKLNKIEKMNLTLTACELDKDHFKDSVKRVKEETNWVSLFN